MGKHSFRKKAGGWWQDHRNNVSIQKMTRNYIKSYINHYKYDQEIMEEFIYPKKYALTYCWWDVTPDKPRVFKLRNLLK